MLQNHLILWLESIATGATPRAKTDLARSLPFAHAQAGGRKWEGECSPFALCGCMAILCRVVECECWVPRDAWEWLKLSLFTGATGEASSEVSCWLFSPWLSHPIQVCFCPGCSLRFSLNLWAPREKASCGVSVYLSDRTHVNTMALVSMATSLAWQALTYLCSKDFSYRPILLPPQSIPSGICSLAGLPGHLGPKPEPPQLSQAWTSHQFSEPSKCGEHTSQLTCFTKPSPTSLCLW